MNRRRHARLERSHHQHKGARIDPRIPKGWLGAIKDLTGVAAIPLSDVESDGTRQVVYVDGGRLVP